MLVLDNIELYRLVTVITFPLRSPLSVALSLSPRLPMLLLPPLGISNIQNGPYVDRDGRTEILNGGPGRSRHAQGCGEKSR